MCIVQVFLHSLRSFVFKWRNRRYWYYDNRYLWFYYCNYFCFVFFPPIFFSFWPDLLVQFCQCIIWVNENNAEIRGTLNNQPVSHLHCLAFWYPQRWSTPLTVQFFPLLAPQPNLTSCQNVTSYKLQRKHRLSRPARKILTQHPWLSCFPRLLSAKASWSWMRFNGRGSICVATSERQVTLLALSG